MDSNQPPSFEQARFEPIEQPIKTEALSADSPQLQNLEDAPPPKSKSPSQPIPSTEPSNENGTMAVPGSSSKKKGTATAAKKAPKRARPGGAKKTTKKARAEPTDTAPDETMEDASEDEESDNGPYCLCRGPDDHRWMICCEKCEDWFHGQCINLDKDIGESLIEKFICPNCTNDNLSTLYKKTCSLGACRKPARLLPGEQSVFCSNEHAQMWWERMVSRLPKSRSKAGLSDQLTQDEFMALLNSGLASIDEEGMLKLVKSPFQEDLPPMQNGDSEGKDGNLPYALTEEEKSFLDNAANARYQLAQETLLCHNMLTLIELAQKRRRAAIDAGRFGEDICGYDYRLDTISARDAFAAFVKSPEGEAVFKAKELGDGDGDGMCERKRCKVHSGWQKMLTLSIKHQIREMAGQAAEVGEEERVMREAAGERWRRKQAESNWVEVLDG